MNVLILAAAFLCSFLLPLGAQSPSLFERIAEPMAPRNIQILIEKEQEGALLEVKGPYYIFNPHDGSRIASGLLGKRFMIHEMENGLKWGEEFPGVHQIYIKARSSDTSIFVNGIQYSGAIAIYGVNGKVHIVNDVDMEAYVKAKLTSQFLVPLEPEVMSALAILARTDAYYHAVRSSASSFWHINAKDVDYQGSALVIQGSLIDHAVDSTRHLILLSRDKEKHTPFATSWTEHSGGKTAPYSKIFRKDSFAPEKGVEAPLAALAREESKWVYQIGKKAFSHLFHLESVSEIELFIDEESSKVCGVRLQNGKEGVDIDFLSLQQKLGASHIKSSEFTAQVKEDSVVFTGFGRGHGTGLCLYSANALAQKGENAVKILSRFFPETYLYNLDAIPK